MIDMNKILKLLEAIISMPIFIIAYMFFCIIIISKVVLKIHRKTMNSFDNYLKNDR
mgnify:CR=1 FL=1